MAARDVPPLAGESHVCVPCGFAYADVGIGDALETLAGLPDGFRVAAGAVPEPRRRARPEPTTWSVVEYVCHVRDVYVTYTIRLHRTRTETRPVLEPMLNDLRARRFGYNERTLEPVLDELAAGVAGFREEIRRFPDDGWERTARRLPGEFRTARWLVRQATHEGVHHLRDVEAVGERVTGPG